MLLLKPTREYLAPGDEPALALVVRPGVPYSFGSCPFSGMLFGLLF